MAKTTKKKVAKKDDLKLKKICTDKFYKDSAKVESGIKAASKRFELLKNEVWVLSQNRELVDQRTSKLIMRVDYLDKKLEDVADRSYDIYNRLVSYNSLPWYKRIFPKI